jgi:hypothetical protein
MKEEVSIEDLLNAVESIPTIKQKRERLTGVVHYEREERIHCHGCGRIYIGIRLRIKNWEPPYDDTTTGWCPNCIKRQEVEWWKQCFEFSVKEVL